ncbi:MAG: GatB/YqeY domain-containing protein [Gammaproteobacteria bacterium]|nr:GatB/YqeY domain-containing protein [Gammaproteobacteria bacterium]
MKERILDDIKTAMRAKDKGRLGVLRLISSAIKQREVDERIELDDTQVIAVLEKMIKQRRDSIEQFTAANRLELADIEKKELEIIQTYMPKQLSDEEISALIDEAIASTGATSAKEMGKVIGILRPKLLGKADMGSVSSKIKQKLQG